jgi:hypothetical protein
MNGILSAVLAPMMVAATMSLVAADPAAAQDACMSNRELQAAIESGEIAPVAQVLDQAGVGRDTQVLSVEVCQQNGGWAYFVGVINAQGEAQTLVLPASG